MTADPPRIRMFVRAGSLSTPLPRITFPAWKISVGLSLVTRFRCGS
jgi:hypothetical protein